MSENLSRRKMLSMLGLGAALGFTLSGVLEPLVAEAQEAGSGHRHSRSRSGHRNTREESADIAARHSPSATGRAPRSPCCTRCNSSSAIAIRAGRTNQKGRGKLMLSSPLSVLAFEKQKLRHLLQKFPRSRKGGAIREVR